MPKVEHPLERSNAKLTYIHTQLIIVIIYSNKGETCVFVILDGWDALQGLWHNIIICLLFSFV